MATIVAKFHPKKKKKPSTPSCLSLFKIFCKTLQYSIALVSCKSVMLFFYSLSLLCSFIKSAVTNLADDGSLKFGLLWVVEVEVAVIEH